MIEKIKAERSGLRVFPEPGQVFSATQPWLKDHLNPLVSIDLSLVNPDWSGVVHVVAPMEHNVGGLAGDWTTEFHGDQSAPNWLAFKLEANGRYQFLGPREYFLLETPPEYGREYLNGHLREQMADSYSQARAEYNEAIRRWRQHHLLIPAWADSADEDNADTIIKQLGGTAGANNWSVEDVPAAFVIETHDDENIAFPRWKESGIPFHFVAEVSASNFYSDAGDSILLFYDPVSQTALITFDWS